MTKTMKKKAIDKPLAPQIDQLASFDLTVITSVFSEDDTISQKKADISIVPYKEDDEEALEPPEEKQRIEKITSCGSFTLKTLKVSVVLVLVLLALVFLVVLIKSGKAFGKW